MAELDQRQKDKRVGIAASLVSVVITVAIVVAFMVVGPNAGPIGAIQNFVSKVGASVSGVTNGTDENANNRLTGVYEGGSVVTVSVLTASGGTVSGEVRREANGYVLAESSDREYSLDEIESLGLSEAELCIAWNEPFARLGYHFGSDGIQGYFESCSWYVDGGEKPNLDPGSPGEVNNTLLRSLSNEAWKDLATD